TRPGATTSASCWCAATPDLRSRGTGGTPSGGGREGAFAASVPGTGAAAQADDDDGDHRDAADGREDTQDRGERAGEGTGVGRLLSLLDHDGVGGRCVVLARLFGRGRAFALGGFGDGGLVQGEAQGAQIGRASCRVSVLRAE